MEVNNRILVVDDNEGILHDFRKLLAPTPGNEALDRLEETLFEDHEELKGIDKIFYELSFASQTEKALELFKHAKQEDKPYSLVFTDVRLPPGTDGVRLIERMWELAPNTEIVIMTAFSDYSWEDLIERLGWSDRLLILRKPFDAITIKQIALMLTQRWTTEKMLRQQRDELTALVKQKEAAEFETLRFREVLNQVGEAILMIDPSSLRVIDCNITACQLLGYERETILQKSIEDLLCPEETDAINWAKSLATQDRNAGPHNRELQLRSEDGREFPAEVSVTLQLYRERKYVVAVVRDISARKLAEEERNNLQNQLRHAQKMQTIGTLAGGIAHDFNNILSPILVYTEMAIKDVPLASTRRDLEVVAKAAYRAKDLVEHILTFCNQVEKEQVPMKIYLIIKEALHLVRASLPATIDIDHRIDTNSGTVLADPTQIHQVLMNLCTNARQAMAGQDGTLKIYLSRAKVDEQDAQKVAGLSVGDYCLLTVSDTGQGMALDVVDRVFEPFFTTKTEGDGTGLGLSVVHGIVQSHGGVITVESAPGEGATFKVFLPLIADPEERGQVDEEETPSGGERILFIDDEDMVANMMGELLTRLGYIVTVQTNSHFAMELFRSDPNRFDVVITDQTMPTLTGLQLTESMLKLRPDLPIILCSGFSESINEASVKAKGVREFILKPIVSRDLVKAINRALRSPVEDH